MANIVPPEKDTELICPVCHTTFKFNPEEHMYITHGGFVCTWQCFLDDTREAREKAFSQPCVDNRLKLITTKVPQPETTTPPKTQEEIVREQKEYEEAMSIIAKVKAEIASTEKLRPQTQKEEIKPKKIKQNSKPTSTQTIPLKDLWD